MNTLALLVRALPPAHERASAPSHAETAAVQVANEICKDMTAKILGAVADDLVLYKHLLHKLDLAVLESADTAQHVQEIVEHFCALNTPVIRCALVTMPAFYAYRQMILFIDAHRRELATAENARALLISMTDGLPHSARNKLLAMNSKQWYAALSPAAFKEFILHDAPVPPRRHRLQHALTNLARTRPSWIMCDTIDVGGPAYTPVRHSARHKYVVYSREDDSEYARKYQCAHNGDHARIGAHARKNKYVFWQDARGLTHFIVV